MKKFTNYPKLLTFGAAFMLLSCSEQEEITPNNLIAQQINNGTIFDLRNGEAPFGGEESMYNGLSTNLTNLPASDGTVLMVRKNYIIAADGYKVICTWNSKAPVDPASLSVSLPYQWKGKFIDQHPDENFHRIWDVNFSIDVAGVATAKFTWNGAMYTPPTVQ